MSLHTICFFNEEDAAEWVDVHKDKIKSIEYSDRYMKQWMWIIVWRKP